MHSSRMRTTCLLTISQHAFGGVAARGCTCLGCTARGVPAWGEYLSGGVYLPGGVPAQSVPAGVYLLRGCNCPGVYLPAGVPALGVPAQVLPP